MILRKKDLVTQFELLTKQQMKEHADYLLASNKAVTQLKLTMESFRKEILEQINKLNLSLLEHERLNSEDKGMILEKINKSISDFNDFTINHLTMERSNDIEHKFLRDTKAETEDIDGLKDDISSLEKSLIGLLEEKIFETFETIKKVYPRIQSTGVAVKEYVDKKLSETLEREDELKEKIRLLGIEKEGYEKEIAVLKKNDFVQEKKIENLYTLIERLNKKMER